MNAHGDEPAGTEERPLEESRQAAPPIEQPLPPDTRGILGPIAMLRHVGFARWDPPEPLSGLISHFWCVEWDLPSGVSHRQDVLPFPSVNVSIGNAPPATTDPGPGPFPVRCYVTGMTREVSPRVLTGRGRNVAVRSTIGGFGAWVDDVSALNELAVDLDEIGIDVTGRFEAWHGLGREAAGDRLAEVLIRAVERRPPARVRAAREVAAWADVAERDRGIRTVAQWAGAVGVSVRTMQRLFPSHVGVPPKWVVRRFRLLEALEQVRSGEAVSWAAVAAELGYADQAHLTRDFTSAIGVTPTDYAAQQR